MIDHNGKARLADFTLLTILHQSDTAIAPLREGGTIQWMGPELLDPKSFGLHKSRPTRESDCYALGMVIYEVLGGQAPFASFKLPIIFLMVLQDKRPERPEGKLFTDSIWKTLELCWKRQPADRISVRTLLIELGGSPLPVRSASDTSGDLEVDGGDQLDEAVGELNVFSVSSWAHP